jgi:FlaG/FlaF family flagellin (archaellin)
MAAVFVVFGTLIALNFGFGYMASESTPRTQVEIENVQTSSSVSPALSNPIAEQNQ